ncbi:MAG: Hydroxyacylglutathione hydrolase (EC [uncultured Caballeronia sp.]|nr:MAG: Hydroxyacylglutathione hydrolase (EC [uncultured Caballeronia sp.]
MTPCSARMMTMRRRCAPQASRPCRRKPTLPTTIGHEKAVNPFLRASVPAIQATLSSQFGTPVSTAWKRFG